MIIHTRTEFMTYLDKTIQAGCDWWHHGNFTVDDSPGPSDLYKAEWYIKNKTSGNWLARDTYWAKSNEERLQERLVDFQKMCAVYHMLFRDRDNFKGDVFWNKIKDATLVLEAYLYGWRFAVQGLAFEDLIHTHPNAMLDVHCPPMAADTQV